MKCQCAVLESWGGDSRRAAMECSIKTTNTSPIHPPRRLSLARALCFKSSLRDSTQSFSRRRIHAPLLQQTSTIQLGALTKVVARENFRSSDPFPLREPSLAYGLQNGLLNLTREAAGRARRDDEDAGFDDDVIVEEDADVNADVDDASEDDSCLPSNGSPPFPSLPAASRPCSRPFVRPICLLSRPRYLNMIPTLMGFAAFFSAIAAKRMIRCLRGSGRWGEGKFVRRNHQCVFPPLLLSRLGRVRSGSLSSSGAWTKELLVVWWAQRGRGPCRGA